MDFIERTYCTDIIQSYCMVVSEIWVDAGLFGGYGYLGLRHYNDGLTFKPSIPDVWDSYNCRIVYKNAKIEVTVDKIKANFKLISGNNFRFTIGDKKIELSINSKEYSYLLNNKSIL